MRRVTVPADSLPERVDVFLARQLPDCSRRRARQLLEAGAVRVNRRRVRKGGTVAAGDIVEITEEFCEPRHLQPNADLIIEIVYEDADLIALNKPAGMPAHALRAEETNTVANFILARYPALAAVGKSALEPGLVHRLDTDTSGLLLVARTSEAYRELRRQFSAHAVTKEYLAVVEGDVAEPGELHSPIGPARHSRRKMRVWPRPGAPARPATTFYRPIERRGRATLLRVRIVTGVMHQIRVHMASIGHPVLGDRLYGNAGSAGPPRHLLHACRLRFAHPRTQTPLVLNSTPPADFTAFLESLRCAPPHD